MADMIKCPICGTDNSQGQKVCSNCQTPLTAAEADSIQPGQVPTKKHTADLEPILPQWLRDARDAARQTDPQDSQESLPQSTDKTRPAATSGDLLAGLQSQAEDDNEEDVPDWLASITGAQPKPKTEPAEPTGARWVEMGTKGDFPQEEPEAEASMPDWLASLQSATPQPEKDELTDWTQDTDEAQASHQQATQPPAFETPASNDETPDWLRQMAMDAEVKSEESAPSDEAPDLSFETPDWLNNLGSAETAQGSESTSVESAAPTFPTLETPEWLKNPSEEKSVQDTTPKWLREEPAETPASETPAWLASEDTIHYSSESQADEPLSDDLLADLPSWLKAAAPQSSLFDQPSEQATVPPATESETPDWIKSFQQAADASAPDEEATGFKESAPFESAPAFTPEFKPEESDLFTEMPDWLSNAVEAGPADVFAAPPPPTPITNEDALAPSDLPSWVQAMRPVEPGGAQFAPALSSDQTLEARGALAGLQGVLPAVPGFTPTSKPKSPALKLQTSDEQMAHAHILEQILTAEASPIPLESLPTLRTSRGLRWFLSALFLIVVSVTVAMRTNIFRMPVLVPNQIQGAVAVAQSIPENAPLLVAFDYEPSRAGEMEAAAAPMFDHLLLLKHPRLTLIATNETGSMLAERFLARPLAEHNYQSGVTYLNLGYLAGGQLGIRAFVQNPTRTAATDITSQSAWNSAALQGVTSIHQFAAMILITDNAEAARAWIEQTQSLRDATPIPFIVISSAQAAPMIEPYFDSGQVTGIVPGLYGGAIFEQYNSGRPGTARVYWDAYSIIMLLSVALLVSGSLWNLLLGLRDRAAAKGAK